MREYGGIVTINKREKGVSVVEIDTFFERTDTLKVHLWNFVWDSLWVISTKKM